MARGFTLKKFVLAAGVLGCFAWVFLSGSTPNTDQTPWGSPLTSTPQPSDPNVNVRGRPALGGGQDVAAAQRDARSDPLYDAEPAAPAHQDDGVNDVAPNEEAAHAAAVKAVVEKPPPSRAPEAPVAEEDTSKIYFEKNEGKSCQNYLNNDATEREYDTAKAMCLADFNCNAIVCPHGKTTACTLRGVPNLVPYAPEDCYKKIDPDDALSEIHPDYNSLLRQYPYQQVTTQSGKQVNIILVRSPFRSKTQRDMFEKYKDKILFMGISSFEDYPLDAMNPFSGRLNEKEYLSIFPGFLHMMHHPEEHFPPTTKTLLMSQSDFNLPQVPFRDYSVPRKYDFTLSGSDQDVHNDCVGWSSYAKNWSFVKEALEVMCGEYHLTGVLVATKNKQGTKACTIPKSCDGLITQTVYLDQQGFFDYLKQSRFSFLPQVHDASPRVSTQALSHDVPFLMNANIKGGWKYMDQKTGEFFHDMSNFRTSLEKIIKNADVPYHYEPRKWITEHQGNERAGKRLYEFVRDNFPDTKLPKGTTALFI